MSQSRDAMSICEMCGGHFEFDPIMQCMKCNFCGNVRKVKTTTNHIGGFDVTTMGDYDHDWGTVYKSIVCQNCGGKTMASPKDMVAYCIYCGSGHVLVKETDDMGMRPKSIVPFRIHMDQLPELSGRWGRDKQKLGLKRIPKAFFDDSKALAFKGIYLPYWAFEMDAKVTWHRDMPVTFGDSQSGEQQKIHKSGVYTNEYVDYVVPGYENRFMAYMDDVSRFDFTELRDYQPSYLAGYYAEKYTVEPNDAMMMAVERIKREIKGKEDASGVMASDHWHFVDIDNVKYNLYLLPFYMTAFWFRKKQYLMVINGQTGEVDGGDAMKKSRNNIAMFEHIKKQLLD